MLYQRDCWLVGKVAALLVVGMVAAAAQAGYYPVEHIGTAVPGHAWSTGYAINDSGQVAATSAYTSGYFRGYMSDDGVTTDVGGLGGNGTYAYGINNNGAIVGYSWRPTGQTTARARAFIWDPINGIQDLEIGSHYSIWNKAYDVNDNNVVVGVSIEQAFKWYGGSVQYLDKMGLPEGMAKAVNNTGIVVGWNGHNEYATRPILWTGTSGTDLGTLNDVDWGTAYDINENGIVVGDSFSQWNVDKRATLWDTNTGDMLDLGTLDGGTSIARGVNDDGLVVGESDGHAFYWNGDQMFDLNDLIAPDSGWELEVATGINNAGEITGYGTFDGQTHGFKLTIPEPSSLILLTGMLLLLNRRR